MQITIGGQKVPFRSGSLRIDFRQGECSTASFMIIDKGALLEFQKGQPVEIRDQGGELVFAGPIESSSFVHEAPGLRLHQIQARCWTYLADKRIVARTWQDATAGQIVRDIVDDYLSDEGVTYPSDMERVEDSQQDFQQGTLSGVVATSEGLKLELL